jgi:hypothetical protein
MKPHNAIANTACALVTHLHVMLAKARALFRDAYSPPPTSIEQAWACPEQGLLTVRWLPQSRPEGHAPVRQYQHHAGGGVRAAADRWTWVLPDVAFCAMCGVLSEALEAAGRLEQSANILPATVP